MYTACWFVVESTCFLCKLYNFANFSMMTKHKFVLQWHHRHSNVCCELCFKHCNINTASSFNLCCHQSLIIKCLWHVYHLSITYYPLSMYIVKLCHESALFACERLFTYIFVFYRLPGPLALEWRSRHLKTSGRSMLGPLTSPGAPFQTISRDWPRGALLMKTLCQKIWKVCLGSEYFWERFYSFLSRCMFKI